MNLPSCKVCILANNSLAGPVLAQDTLPVNLTWLDLSDNQLSGSLPSALPPHVTVLDVSGNKLSGRLPSKWCALDNLAQVTLGNNMFTGKLPAAWSEWGKHSKNSLQLSVVNTSLSGQVPQQWVEQFCLSTFQSTETTVQNLSVQTLLFSDSLTTQLGTDFVQPAQQASINVTLGNKLYTFDYNSPDSICGIPNAERNLGLLWGTFAALLVLVLVGVHLWLRRKQSGASNGLFSKLGKVTAWLHNDKLHVPKQVASRLQYLLFDVVYFVYSQVTDIITIHQVFASRQLRYAYTLLGFLLLPYIFMLLLVAKANIRVCRSGMKDLSQLQTILVCVVGVLLSPVMLLVLEIGLILHGLGVPVPQWLRSADVSVYSVQRLQTYSESCLNALPQTILQSRLYLLGNDPNGTHVYIDTMLFLVSASASMASVLKTVAVFRVERHMYGCSFVEYCTKLFAFQSLEQYAQLVQQHPVTHVLVNP